MRADTKHLIGNKSLHQLCIEKMGDEKKGQYEYDRCRYLIKKYGYTPEQAFNYSEKKSGRISAKHKVDGTSMYTYIKNKLGCDDRTTRNEYRRVQWLMEEKCMSVDEALYYHRPPANPEQRKFNKLVYNRKKKGFPKELLYVSAETAMKIKADKQTKYFYRALSFIKYCRRHKLPYTQLIRYAKIYKKNITEIMQHYIKGKGVPFLKKQEQQAVIEDEITIMKREDAERTKNYLTMEDFNRMYGEV